MRTCQYCGSEDIEYTGADDGGGDYGSSVCDQWHCNSCDQDFETDCIDGDDLDDEISRDEEYEHERPDEALHPHQGEWF